MVQMKWFGGPVLALALVLVTNNADAHHHWHSCGSFGSCGSSGGSYGSWGSSGGSWGSHGSHGSWGSSGSSGSYGSYGSSGSSGSSGSYGGGLAAAVNTPRAADPVLAAEPADRAHLVLNVPSNAVVYLSNQRMTLEGTVREYTVPGLKAGLEYRYPVRVDVVRDGAMVTASANQQIQAGQRVNLLFNDSAGQSELVSMRQ